MIALKNANVYTIAQGLIENCSILINHGKIEKVGRDIEIPNNANCYDMTGKSITPGFIDAHCHVGIFNEGTGDAGSDGNDYSNPVTPEVRAIDGIYPDDEGFQDALEHGVTTLCITPGSANVVGGQAAIIKPKSRILNEMIINPFVGLKCAFGENPKRVYGSRNVMPTTRMGVAAVLRKTLFEAQKYLVKKEFEENKPVKENEPKAPFEKDFNKEIFIPILKKEKPLRAHAHRMDDIQTAIRIAEEFDVKIVIEHCTEGYKIADFLAAKGVPIIIGPLNGTKPKVELKDSSLDAPRILAEAGVDFAVMTDAPVERIGSLFDDIRLFIRRGLSDCAGLKAVTINPAEILGIADRVGSIEPGKDADLNIFDKNPFDFSSKIETVLIEGNIHFGELK